MVEQGSNRSFYDSWRYGNPDQQHLGLSQLVLTSPSPIILMMDLELQKLEFGVTRTTHSGIFIACTPCAILVSYNFKSF